ncbi:T9SS type A sorting domain-containing protein [Jejuia pallidilutea]|uniref:T9SS type A sorting domain-containing protein n=1 Tax=Jejuia pallidilutea TaxID=504487 RepID=UPI0034E197C0
MYPNPTANKFTIAFDDIFNIERIEIYNILGKRVYQKTLKSSILEVENTGLITGVYLVKAISDNNKVYHSKLIVK